MGQHSASVVFDQLFKQVPTEEIHTDIFRAVGTSIAKDHYLITAGKENHYNSMVGSGSFGTLMKKPTNWSFIRSDRYTLELMKKEQTYTLSYFSDEYKKQLFFLGSKTGKDSEKMKEVELTGIQTPSGNISFSEARLIIECKLMILTTVTPDDLCSQEVKDYVIEEYTEESHYRKVAFGEVTHVWVRR